MCACADPMSSNQQHLGSTLLNQAGGGSKGLLYSGCKAEASECTYLRPHQHSSSRMALWLESFDH